VLEQVAQIERIVSHFGGMGRSSFDEASEMDLRHAVEQACEMMQLHNKVARAALTLRLPETPIPVWGSQDAVRQILLNLVHNASLAIEGAAEQGIVVEVRCEDGTAVCIVHDTGPGVPEELRERIMEPFFTTRKSGEGSGLGLALCAHLSRQMGGELTLMPSTAGARFVLRLPMFVPEIAAQAG